jgi:hypothetical protein
LPQVSALEDEWSAAEAQKMQTNSRLRVESRQAEKAAKAAEKALAHAHERIQQLEKALEDTEVATLPEAATLRSAPPAPPAVPVLLAGFPKPKPKAKVPSAEATCEFEATCERAEATLSAHPLRSVQGKRREAQQTLSANGPAFERRAERHAPTTAAIEQYSVAVALSTTLSDAEEALATASVQVSSVSLPAL